MTLLVRGVSKRLRKLNQQSLEVNGELTQSHRGINARSSSDPHFGGQDYEQKRFDEKS